MTDNLFINYRNENCIVSLFSLYAMCVNVFMYIKHFPFLPFTQWDCDWIWKIRNTVKLGNKWLFKLCVSSFGGRGWELLHISEKQRFLVLWCTKVPMCRKGCMWKWWSWRSWLPVTDLWPLNSKSTLCPEDSGTTSSWSAGAVWCFVGRMQDSNSKVQQKEHIFTLSGSSATKCVWDPQWHPPSKEFHQLPARAANWTSLSSQ